MHKEYLLQALQLADLRRGFCAPNPAVGAVVVKENRILSTGFHDACGKPHAEVDALNKLSQSESQDATIYISLEPCCHWGKTPPCTTLLIERGIKQVIYGFKDNNPEVAGKSEPILTAAGITCSYFPLPEIAEFYASYQHWRHTLLPWVTAKIAMSLDAKIAGPNGERIAISGDHSQKIVHQWRKRSDALLTTAKTIINDDPQLNARIDEKIYPKPIYILDTNLRTPLIAKIFNTANQITIFHRIDAPAEKIQYFVEKGVTCYGVNYDTEGLALKEVMKIIGDHGVHDLGIEAGGKCFTAFIRQKLVQSAIIFIAAKTLGNNATPAFNSHDNLFASASNIQWQNSGDDIACHLTWEN